MENMAENMKRVGDSVLSISYVSIQKEIEAWESTAFDLTEKVYNLEEEPQTDRTIHKITDLKKRLHSLEKNIGESKK